MAYAVFSHSALSDCSDGMPSMRRPALPVLARHGRSIVPVLAPLFRQLVQHTPPDQNLLHIWHDALLPHAMRLPESHRMLFGHALAGFCAELLEHMARLFVVTHANEARGNEARGKGARSNGADFMPAGDGLLRTVRQAARLQHADTICAIPGTWKGEFARAMALISCLPAALPVGDLCVENKEFAASIQFALSAIAYGYTHLLSAALATGRPIPLPDQHDTWLTAALHSGAASVLGAVRDTAVQRNGLHAGSDVFKDALVVQLHACLVPSSSPNVETPPSASPVQEAPTCASPVHPGGRA